ncbi:NB-ARC domain-containing protein [Cryptosporangium aurantiacum]|uniref:WD40 repeat n=1 Tax=Cryptosporangium aurantiacum TaxID=134849 RepID=A0A1M7NES4_9ACTN|nr:NB-ARC domain-containing protein [Cryptosporangium aurantiacum]SHN01873.1 WD40 repeat [Cryptosporangium aurantiacum]
MPSPALRVFLSHTDEFRRFPEGRSFVDAAENAVTRAGCLVTDMAYFPAQDRLPAEVCRQKVREADVWVGILGLRYGSPVRDEPEHSYTELEFEAATEAGLPRLVFLLDAESVVPIPAAHMLDAQHADRQEAFRQRVREAGVVTRKFVSPDELALELHHALVDLGQHGPRAQRLFMAPARTHRIVQRPALSDRLVEALTNKSLIGLTALGGAGGFGKTTLAGEACRDPRIAEQFPDGVLWLTLGEHVAGADLAAAINELAEQITGERPSFTDPEQAGHHLGRLLGGRRALLVCDDVWHRHQLEPLLLGAPQCTRLVTTRVHAALPDGTPTIDVDAMSVAEADEMLADGLPEPAPDLSGLLGRTGRWPVLLRLVNGALRRYLRRGAPAADAVRRVEERLAKGGPASWDPANPARRQEAVAATLEASLELLDETGRGRLDRYLELAIFPEDVRIPQRVLEVFWRSTGGLDADQVEHLCLDLADLSLVADYWFGDEPWLRLHDVVRHYLRHRIDAGLPALNAALLDAYRTGLPHWWALPDSAGYLWQQLTTHLAEAELTDELDALVTDLRWLTTALHRTGPAGIEADLARSCDPTAAVLERAIRQNAHLLTPLDPPHALDATLVSRLTAYPELRERAEQHLASLGPVLRPVWPLPSSPHPGLIRVLGGPAMPLGDVVMSPDGTWLATPGREDGTVYLWNSDGTRRAELSGDPADVRVRISPDSRWLAVAQRSVSLGRQQLRDVYLWNADGSRRAALPGHLGATAVVISPDGTWLATAARGPNRRGRVRLWNADGSKRTDLPGDVDALESEWAAPFVGISPDGTWLATWNRSDTTVRVWHPDGSPRARIRVASAEMIELAPDGRWLAIAGAGGVALWTPDGVLHAEMPGRVDTLKLSPDGQWLATGLGNTVVLWDSDGTRRGDVPLPNPASGLLISPDSTWFVIASGRLPPDQPTTQFWGADGTIRAVLPRSSYSHLLMSISPDSARLLAPTQGGGMGVWDSFGVPQATFSREAGRVSTVRTSPDGTVAAVASAEDGAVRLWSLPGVVAAGNHGTRGLLQFLAASDGTWFAVIDSAHGRVRLLDGVGAGRAMAEAVRGGLILSPDETWFAVVNMPRDEMTLWTRDGAPLGTVTDPRGGIRGVAISGDARWLATAGRNGTVRLWNLDGTLRASIAPPHAGGGMLRSIEVSPDGSWLLTRHVGDDLLRLWNADGTPRATVPTPTVSGERTRAFGALMSHAALSPDGTWFLVAGTSPVGRDETVRLWNSDGTPRASIHRHAQSGGHPVISPDGTWIAVPTGDGVDVCGADGAVRCSIVAPLNGGTPIRISADSRWLVTSRVRADLTGDAVMVWTSDGEARGSYPATTAAISGDSRYLATAERDGTVRISELASGRQVTALRIEPRATGLRWLAGSARLLATGAQGLTVLETNVGGGR